MPSDFSQNQDVTAEELSPIVILHLNLPRGYCPNLNCILSRISASERRGTKTTWLGYKAQSGKNKLPIHTGAIKENLIPAELSKQQMKLLTDDSGIRCSKMEEPLMDANTANQENVRVHSRLK